jgi:hypothetical protein
VAAAAREQFLGLLAPVASEVTLQQVDHRPQMASLFDVYLEQIAKVVERRRGTSQMALLFDRGGFGVALRDDDAAQLLAVFAGHLLPGIQFGMIAEADFALELRREKNSPSIFRHPHVRVIRPSLGRRAYRRA